MAAHHDSVLTFPFPVPPAPGEVLEILPGLYSVRMPLPLKLDHVNVWVFDDGDGLLVIDTGIADEPTIEWLRQARARLPKKPITRVLVTHHHPDHCGLADRICEEHGAELLMSAQAYGAAVVLQHRSHGTDAASTAASLAKHGLSPEAQQYLVDNASELDFLKPGMPPTFTALADGDTLSIGGYECTVIFGQGHAPDHVCLYAAGRERPSAGVGASGAAADGATGAGRAAAPTGCPGGACAGPAGFLISGDMLLPHISSHVGSPASWLLGNPVAQFQKSVRKLAALPADTLVLPSHGGPFLGARERVRELEQHHEQRCLAMAAVLGEPHSAAELLSAVFRRELDPLQLVFAMNETIAHLEYMTDRNDLVRLEGEDGVTRYVRREPAGGSAHEGRGRGARPPAAGQRAPLMTPSLFEPSTIRGMRLANRFVRSATWEGMADDDGRATPGLLELYAALARGGVGLVMTSHAYVSAEGQAVGNQLGVHDDALLPSLEALAASVHGSGGAVALQLAHGGLWSLAAHAGAVDGGGTTGNRDGAAGGAERAQPLGPSVRYTDTGPTGREMSLTDIAAVTAAFAAGARRAGAAGFDAVQIHAAHGYLLSEFLSPLFNHRTDEYGGDIARRARLVVEVVAAVRAEVGPDYPVLIKINSEDFVAGGSTVDDMLEVAALVVAAGVDAIEISGGTSLSGDLGPVRTRAGIPQDHEAYYQDAALRLKQRVMVPVMLVGGIRTFATAEASVSHGFADYVCLSRPLVCEPDLVARWQRGDVAPSTCRSDNRCFYKALKREGMYCPHVQAGWRGPAAEPTR